MGVWGRTSWPRLACEELHRGWYSENSCVLGYSPRTFTLWTLARLTLVQEGPLESFSSNFLVLQLGKLRPREEKALF